MLAATFYGLGTPLVSVEFECAIRILFSNVSFVRKIPLKNLRNYAYRLVCSLTAFKTTMISVPISRGVEAMQYPNGLDKDLARRKSVNVLVQPVRGCECPSRIAQCPDHCAEGNILEYSNPIMLRDQSEIFTSPRRLYPSS